MLLFQSILFVSLSSWKGDCMVLMIKPRGSSTSSFVCLSKFPREFGGSFSKFMCRDYCKCVKIFFFYALHSLYKISSLLTFLKRTPVGYGFIFCRGHKLILPLDLCVNLAAVRAEPGPSYQALLEICGSRGA